MISVFQYLENIISLTSIPGPVVQFVVSPIADSGVVSLILVRSHTFVEIDYEIIVNGRCKTSTQTNKLLAYNKNL